MADRMNQFPMLPANFAPTLPGQGGQLSQQPPQQQQQDATVGGLPNPDHSRLWQQMQQHMQQQQQQLRAANGGPGDINGTQVNQQMADFLRAPGMQQQQQQQQQLQQQRNGGFGLGPPGVSIGQSSGGASFPDISGNNLGSGFNPQNVQLNNNGNNPMAQMNAAQLQAFQQTRNVNMLHALSNQPQVSRQLELIGMAQNQQPQNGPVGTGSRLGQQQLGQNGFQQGMSASPAGGGVQPGSGNIGGMASFSGPGGMEQKRNALAELRDKAVHLHNSLQAAEQAQMSFAGQRPAMQEHNYQQQASIFEADVSRKRVVLNKWNMMLSANGMPPVGGNGPVMNPIGPSPGPQNNMMQQQQQQNNQGPQNWIAAAHATASQQNNPQPPLGFQNPHMSPNQHLQPMLSAQSNAQNGSQMSLQPGQGPPRSLSSQQLMPGRGNGNQPSPNLAPQFPQQLNATAATNGVPPLDRNRFNGSYRHFCQTKKLKLDNRLLAIQNRPIDLHSLHVEVMNAGGHHRVSGQDLWPAIGGKIGYVQFQANDTEPARCTPETAQHLEHIYKEYLSIFDTIYIASYVQEAQKRRAQAQIQGQQQQPPQPSNQPPPGPQGPQQGPSGQVRTGGAFGANNNNMNVQGLIPYAYVPAAELRMRGLSEKAIQWIEEKRMLLQRMYDEHAAQSRNGNPNVQQGVPPAQKVQAPQQGLGNMPPAGNTGALTNPAVFGNRHPMSNGGQGFPQRTPENSMNNPLSINGENNMNQQRPGQQPQPGMGPGPGPLGPVQPRRRPTPEEMTAFALFVQKTKRDYSTRSITTIRLAHVPDEQRMEYNMAFENLWRYILEVDPRLTTYAAVLPQELVKKLIAMVLTCQQQKSLLLSNPPKYILELQTVRVMSAQIQNSVDMFTHSVQMMGLPPPPQQQQQQAPQPLTPGSGSQSSPPQGAPIGIPPVNQPTGTTISIPPAQAVPVSRAPSVANTASSGRNANVNKRSVSDGNSGASISTPPQSAPTPAASSPPTKSPKGKARPKPVPKGRKPSTKSVNTNGSASISATTPASANAISDANTNANANVPSPSPAVEPASASTPAAATPASVATPGSEASLKRRRDDEESAPTPSTPTPKRPKINSDFDGTPSEALVKRNEQIEKIKTDEDASKFLEEVTELIKQASGVEGQASMASDITDTLDQIFKSYTSGTDLPRLADAADISGLSDRRPPSPSAGIRAISDEFGDFFDFSSFEGDDSASKAPTPDLVPTSSTNPSPESNSDPLGTPFITDLTAMDDSATDLRRLGMWKEIDGGEGAFFQQDNWKWGTPMPTMDQSWAIFQ